MEEDSREILSPLLNTLQVKKQFEYLENTVKESQKRVDYTVAHDPDVLKAIDTVERFLRKQKRVCYGGQAINALLPKDKQFYDPNYNVPDYDFFSPNPDADVDELVDILAKEGFDNISKKVGVHEGTMKVYVNYIPIADISLMHPQLFKIIQKRAQTVNGILYCDPDFLRMLMHLELSRPRGEVSRWRKVYERLILLNNAFPVNVCSESIRTPPIDLKDRKAILEFCIKRKHVVVSPEYIELFENPKRVTLDSLVRLGGPVLFFSNESKNDGNDLKDILQSSAIKVTVSDALTDQLFSFVSVTRRGIPIALIFQEDACHSYTTMRVDTNEIRIATPDLYLHLYYSLNIFGKKEKMYFETSLDCLIQKLHSLLRNSRNRPTQLLPAFGLKCSGRQKGIATLLHEKAERTKIERSKTEKSKKPKLRRTRKS